MWSNTSGESVGAVYNNISITGQGYQQAIVNIRPRFILDAVKRN